MNLTKKEIKQGREIVNRHIREEIDPSPTWCEIVMCLIEQDDSYLREVIKNERRNLFD